MEVRCTVLGGITIRSGHEAEIDVGGLIRRLIMFDRVIVRHGSLGELPVLVETFGPKGFQELLDTGTLKFSDLTTSVSAFPSIILDSSAPLGQFTLTRVQPHARANARTRKLRFREGVPNLKSSERNSLEQAIHNSLLRPPKTFGINLEKHVHSELRIEDAPSLRSAVLESLKRGAGLSGLTAEQINLDVEEPEQGVFQVKTTIPQDFKISAERTRFIVMQAVQAVANLSHRLAEMEAYSAITGFLDSEAPILFGKVAPIIAPFNPNVPEEQFKRVIEIADVPDFVPGQTVDVQKLMSIRESAECRDFRGWLSTVEKINDAEIRDAAEGFKSRLASLAGSSGGKVARFAATVGIGFIPGAGLLLGPAVSAIDTFLVERVLPRSGILAFLTDTYPSLFRSP